ncbi:MAG TPA: pilus assembly protein TadG-related protein [Actinotalea sp.]|nr:pilus assembly protein TadG-related protein [Actinotalea sp.]
MTPRTVARGDDGQIMLLAIAYGVLALLLVTAVVSAGSVHLDRKRLLALADLAALEAADALDVDAYYGRAAGDPCVEAPCRPGDLVVLSHDTVRAAVEQYVARAAPASGPEDVTILDATTPDGRTAVVRLGAVSRPSLLSWVTAPWQDGVVLRVSASARAG